MSDFSLQSGDRRWSPRILWQKLLRFLSWSALVILAGILLTVVVGLFAYFNRVNLINDALANYVEPFDVSVEKIDFLPLGTVSISELQLRPKQAKVKEPLLSVPLVTLTYRFQELRTTRKFRIVVFEEPSIELSEDTLHELQETRKSPASKSTPLDLNTFSFFTETLSFVNGKVSLDLVNAPPLSAHWNLKVESPAFDEGGWLVSPIEWDLSSVAIGPDGKWGSFDKIQGDLAFRGDLTAARISNLEIPDSHLTITPEWLTRRSENSAPDENKESPSRPIFDLSIGRLKVGKTLVQVKGFDGSNGYPKNPDIRLETQFSLNGITSTNGRWDSQSPLKIELSNVGIGPEAQPLSFAEIITLEADSLGAAVHEQQIKRLELVGWNLVVTKDTVDDLPAFGGENKDANAISSSESDPSIWNIGEIEMVEGHLLTDGIKLSEVPLPRIETQFQATLENLTIGGKLGLESDGLQRIVLEQSRLWAPNVEPSKEPPLLSVQRADATARWSEFSVSNRIQSLTLRGPEINFTDETLGSWIDPPKPSAERSGPIDRPVYKVANLLVTGGHLTVDSNFADQVIPKVVADFRVETIEGSEASPFTYDFTLTDLTLKNHAVFLEQLGEGNPDENSVNELPGRLVNEEDVLQMEQLKLRATASGLQRKQEIESLEISGALLTVGDGLNAIAERTTPQNSDSEKSEDDRPVAEEPSNPPTNPAPLDRSEKPLTPAETPDQAAASEPSAEVAAGNKLPTWTIKKLEVVGSTIQFEALIPQIEGLKFDVNTVLNQVPLSPDGLLAQTEIQQVELSNIEIKDPYNSFITVAELPTIFIQFSLAGLVNQEIHQIDLINPSLYVGQGLFWWIDYQRNFRAQNEGASIGLAQEGAVAEKPDWTIRQINATAGKIVIAPTGIPIGIVPIPFNATTKLENGEIELTLKIPEEEHVYSFPDYEVELSGLTGDVLFNVPVKDESNNLVQKFFLDQIKWKKYEAEDLYLVVTFDEEGIYGELGGYAYQGYVKAGFNFYLDNPGKWDAWISGTDLSTSPITQILAPDNFLMEGPISVDLISEGFRKKLGETTAEIQTTGPGWFDVTKLDAILDNFPEDWTGWQKSLADLSLIALKRFDYDKGSGSLYLLGRDGLFSLRFAGPYGIRELNLHLHDNRNTTAGVSSDTATESIENPPAKIAD